MSLSRPAHGRAARRRRGIRQREEIRGEEDRGKSMGESAAAGAGRTDGRRASRRTRRLNRAVRAHSRLVYSADCNYGCGDVKFVFC